MKLSIIRQRLRNHPFEEVEKAEHAALGPPRSPLPSRVKHTSRSGNFSRFEYDNAQTGEGNTLSARRSLVVTLRNGNSLRINDAIRRVKPESHQELQRLSIHYLNCKKKKKKLSASVCSLSIRCCLDLSASLTDWWVCLLLHRAIIPLIRPTCVNRLWFVRKAQVLVLYDTIY